MMIKVCQYCNSIVDISIYSDEFKKYIDTIGISFILIK